MSEQVAVVKVLGMQCNAMMRYERRVACVQHIFPEGESTETYLVRFVCDTADCGNELIVEEDILRPRAGEEASDG